MLAVAQEPATEPLRFLVVEDNHHHAEIILRTLRRNRLVAHVDRVPDGEQAIAYLRAEGRYAGRSLPDVILLDLKLPKIDGHEVLERIKQDSRLRPIPAVVLSTSSAEQDRAAAYRHGANSYLVKPVNFLRFRQLLDDLIVYWGIWNRPAPTEDEPKRERI